MLWAELSSLLGGAASPQPASGLSAATVPSSTLSPRVCLISSSCGAQRGAQVDVGDPSWRDASCPPCRALVPCGPASGGAPHCARCCCIRPPPVVTTAAPPVACRAGRGAVGTPHLPQRTSVWLMNLRSAPSRSLRALGSAAAWARAWLGNTDDASRPRTSSRRNISSSLCGEGGSDQGRRGAGSVGWNQWGEAAAEVHHAPCGAGTQPLAERVLHALRHADELHGAPGFVHLLPLCRARARWQSSWTRPRCDRRNASNDSQQRVAYTAEYVASAGTFGLDRSNTPC